jgi:hypothetical protein
MLAGLAGLSGKGAAAGGGGGPPGVTGLIGWWDASAASSLSLSGSNVNSIADQSGQGNNLSAASPPVYSATGLNSRPSMDFSGTTGAGLIKNSFAFGTGNTLTVFFVGQFTKLFSTAYGRAVSLSAGPGYTGITGTTTDQDNNYSFSLGQEGTGDNIVLYRNASIADRSFPGDGTPHRCIATIDSSGVMTIYVDGVATTGNTLNTAFASGGQLQIGNVSSTGSNAHWHGQLSEIGISPNFTNSTNVAALDTFLKTKWGL